MELKLIGNILVVETGLRNEDVKRAQKHAPHALRVRDEDGNDVFILKSVTDVPSGALVAPHALVCNSVKDGLLSASLTVPESMDATSVVDSYGKALLSAMKYVPVIKEQVQNELVPLDALVNSITTL